MFALTENKRAIRIFFFPRHLLVVLNVYLFGFLSLTFLVGRVFSSNNCNFVRHYLVFCVRPIRQNRDHCRINPVDWRNNLLYEPVYFTGNWLLFSVDICRVERLDESITRSTVDTVKDFHFNRLLALCVHTCVAHYYIGAADLPLESNHILARSGRETISTIDRCVYTSRSFECRRLAMVPLSFTAIDYARLLRYSND